jgi:hypothetical protein
VEHLFPHRTQYHLCAIHADCAVEPPAWLSSRSLAGLEDDFSALKSPFAKRLGADPAYANMTRWQGYFEQQARLDNPTIDLLESCDGQRTVRQIAEEWEAKYQIPEPGEGYRNLLALEGYGLVYLKEIPDQAKSSPS